jgi:hypothetical protein
MDKNGHRNPICIKLGKSKDPSASKRSAVSSILSSTSGTVVFGTWSSHSDECDPRIQMNGRLISSYYGSTGVPGQTTVGVRLSVRRRV